MTYLLLTIYYLLFAVLAWRRLPWAVLFVVATLPSYLIRFHVGPVPMTLLEGMILIIAIIWAIQKIVKKHAAARNLTNLNWGLRVPMGVFLAAATVSVFASPDLHAAAGIWKAYFIEPLIFFLVLRDLLSYKLTTSTNPLKSETLNLKFETIPNDQNSKRFGFGVLDLFRISDFGFRISREHIIGALSITALLLSVYAIFQRFTSFGIPPPWDRELRVTSIFPYPNALALFLGPLVPLFMAQSLAFVLRRGQKLSFYQVVNIGYWLMIVAASILAIVFAKSTGALVGIAAGLLFMGLLVLRGKAHDRELFHARQLYAHITIAVLAALAAFTVLASPSLKDELLLRNWSGHVRRTQWTETIEMLKDRPVLGVGLAGYKETLAPYHKATYLEIFEYPHNIVLNFWSETGLLGVIAFAWLIVIFFHHAFKSLVIGHWSLVIGAMGAMVTLLIHGAVDVPYFKNDLAMLFWIIFALRLTQGQKSEMMQS